MPPSFDCKNYCKTHIKACKRARCKWFRIYDIIEGVYKLVFERTRSNPGATSVLAKKINKGLRSGTS
jgi:hypothetical protein